MREEMASEAMAWSRDLPLDVVFAFWGKGVLSVSPEEMVEGLLTKVQ
jgi:hypothetical protein